MNYLPLARVFFCAGLAGFLCAPSMGHDDSPPKTGERPRSVAEAQGEKKSKAKLLYLFINHAGDLGGSHAAAVNWLQSCNYEVQDETVRDLDHLRRILGVRDPKDTKPQTKVSDGDEEAIFLDSHGKGEEGSNGITFWLDGEAAVSKGSKANSDTFSFDPKGAAISAKDMFALLHETHPNTPVAADACQVGACAPVGGDRLAMACSPFEPSVINTSTTRLTPFQEELLDLYCDANTPGCPKMKGNAKDAKGEPIPKIDTDDDGIVDGAEFEAYLKRKHGKVKKRTIDAGSAKTEEELKTEKGNCESKNADFKSYPNETLYLGKITYRYVDSKGKEIETKTVKQSYKSEPDPKKVLGKALPPRPQHFNDFDAYKIVDKKMEPEGNRAVFTLDNGDKITGTRSFSTEKKSFYRWSCDEKDGDVLLTTANGNKTQCPKFQPKFFIRCQKPK